LKPSHSSRDNRQAVAVKAWLVELDPGLAEDIFVDLEPAHRDPARGALETGTAAGEPRCEAVIAFIRMVP
jgi:hypothetical protein